MKLLSGGLSNIEGIRLAGVKEGKKGLALVVFDKAYPAAGVFTTNKLKAAPVQLTQGKLKEGNSIQAAVLNSGNANCATGWRGMKDAKSMCGIVSNELELNPSNVAVGSTGIIGKFMDMTLIKNQIMEAAQKLGSTKSDNDSAAEAIMTTDTKPKSLCMDFGDFRIAGIAKGAGMILPNMATMLCVIATDAKLDGIGDALRKSVADSFNMISIDNDMSTNDMVLLVSTGKAGKSKNFLPALTEFCQEMAKMMVRDGEGVTKLVEIQVKGAKNEEDARRIAKHISTSSLVKTAMFGNNPNWGRVAAATGSSGAEVDFEKLKIWFDIGGEKTLLYKGGAQEFDFKGTAKKLETSQEVKIIVDCGLGTGNALSWSGDMSYEYVKINAEYT